MAERSPELRMPTWYAHMAKRTSRAVWRNQLTPAEATAQLQVFHRAAIIEATHHLTNPTTPPTTSRTRARANPL